MKKSLTLAMVALVALAMGLSAPAESQQPTRASLERRIEWQDQHIRQLNQRRAYLHRYIRHLRNPAPSRSSTGGTTTTTPTSSGGWSDELRAAGWPEWTIPHMLYIIDRESGGNPNAINSSSGACGLTQLYPCYGGAAWLDPMTNLRLALQKFRAAGGFAPWGG